MAGQPPDTSSKLAAPSKKSIFERQKAEVEAKRAREKAETAAVLEDFVKSFDDGGDEPSFPSKRGALGGGGGGGGGGGSNQYAPGPGKRHFTSSGLKSGPGSLGPSPPLPKSGPGSLGPASAFGKKRHYDDYSGGARDRESDRDRKARMFAYKDDRDRGSRRDTDAFAEDDEEGDADELKAAAKPTLHLSSLPQGTSAAFVKGLFAPSPLTIEDVRLLPGSTNDRRSISAIVTMAAETPATDIDTTVSHLQNKYLGFGFNLSISRHLSSAALTGHNPLGNTPSGPNSLPFGARPVVQHTSLSRAPPPGRGGGRFAPPASYTSSTPYGRDNNNNNNNTPQTQVTVQAPHDLKQLRLIHKTLEALLTYGPEFEALLMSRPEIQRDEQWAWLWNSRSTGGVYYRWRLWEIVTDAKARRRRQPASGYNNMRPQGDTLFEGQSVWVAPEEGLKFEYTTKLEDFVGDEDYNSSDEEGDESGGLARRYHDHQRVGPSTDPVHEDGMGYLNPLAKTKLVHLLARLPESNTKLRRGDVARVTGFAIEHAGAGAEEVAALVTRNVIRPFRYSVKNKRPDDQDQASDEEDDKPTTTENEGGKPVADTTAASLVGLFVISDVLSASASAGVRHAWRYRSLFETQLRLQSVFAILGRAPRTYDWGKLKADKWRRSVQNILALWEGWCVFPSPSHEAFAENFSNPPLTEGEEKEARQKEQQAAAEKATEKAASRWRSVDQDGNHPPAPDGVPMLEGVVDRDGDRDGDGDVHMDGTPMADDDDDGGDDLADDNLDGVEMLDSSDEENDADQGQDDGPDHDEVQDRPPSPGEPEPTPAPSTMAADPTQASAAAESNPAGTPTTKSPTSHGRRARPRAADFDDMFE